MYGGVFIYIGGVAADKYCSILKEMPVTNSAVLAQIHLSGEVDCLDFKPHMLKANFCINCSKLVNKHSASAIPDEDCLLRVSEQLHSRLGHISWINAH